MSVLSQPQFHHEEAAFSWLEATLWPHGPVCPHCGGMGRIGKIKANPEKRVRLGLHKCGDCKKQFTVKVGTVFEHARIPLHKMLQAMHLICSSKKGVSSHHLHRILEVQYKTARFLSHRIREAMRDGEPARFGSGGGMVEVDETFIGNDHTVKSKDDRKGRGYAQGHRVLSLVNRDMGHKRSVVVDNLRAKTLFPILKENIVKEARAMTNAVGQCGKLSATLTGGHGFTQHSQGEYVASVDYIIHTNTIEDAFSVPKRSMKGVYQYCGKHHLHQCLAELNFRHNNRVRLDVDDASRADRALRGIVGKQLMYRDSLPTR